MQSNTLGIADNANTFQINQRTHLDVLSDANNLFDAFQLSQKGSSWKASSQRCDMNLLRTIHSLQNELRTKTYRQCNFTEFVMTERGKIRPIRSLHIRDRIVQRSLCDNILLPLVRPYLIYDNGASLENRGISFSRKRIKVHLDKYVRHNGPEGYVLLIDFSKFFDNIPHDLLLRKFKRIMKDNSIDWLLDQVINSFSPDVSYMDDEEYKTAEDDVFDSMVSRKRLSEFGGRKGEKYIHKSMGIGSQISQIGGIFYPTEIDNYFKIVKGFKYYGRYMDDCYLIHKDKEKLEEALIDFISMANELKMHVNPKKIIIAKINNWFVYLKERHRVDKLTGRRYVKLHKDTFNRERRRLKKLRIRLSKEKIDFLSIYNSYLSWRGNVIKYPRNVINIDYTDRLFIKLFKNELLFTHKKFKENTEVFKDK